MLLRVMALCMVAMLICAALRPHRPEIATVVSLATGAASLVMLYEMVVRQSDVWEGLIALFHVGEGEAEPVIKAAGISIIAELGAQICIDAGERALAGRITLAARVAIIGLCVPLLLDIVGSLEELLL